MIIKNELFSGGSIQEALSLDYSSESLNFEPVRRSHDSQWGRPETHDASSKKTEKGPFSFTKRFPKLYKYILRPEYITVPCSIVSGVRSFISAAGRYLPISTSSKALGSLRFVSCATVPISIYHLGLGILKVARGTINEKIDAALDASCNLGTLGDTATTVAGAVESLGLVASKSLMWVTPLAIVSLVLDSAGVVLNLKALAENILFQRHFTKSARLQKTVEQYTVEDYQKGVACLNRKNARERSFVRKHFQIGEKKLMKRLGEIEKEATEKIASANTRVVNEAKKLMHETMKALKKRVTIRMLSNVLGIVAASTSLVGVAIILFTPVAPLGYALLGVGAILGIAKVVFDYEMTRRFENKLELNGKGVQRYFFPLPSCFVRWQKKKKQTKKMESPALSRETTLRETGWNAKTEAPKKVVPEVRQRSKELPKPKWSPLGPLKLSARLAFQM